MRFNKRPVALGNGVYIVNWQKRRTQLTFRVTIKPANPPPPQQQQTGNKIQYCTLLEKQFDNHGIFISYLVMGLEWMSYIVDFHCNPSTNIRWNLNFRRFFSYSVGLSIQNGCVRQANMTSHFYILYKLVWHPWFRCCQIHLYEYIRIRFEYICL